MSELDIKAVKEQADALGIKYHHNANAKTIQKNIDAFVAENSKANGLVSEEGSEFEFGGPVNQEQVQDGKIVPYTSEDYRKRNKRDNINRSKRLKRIRVTCMNPTKREWKGEIITVASPSFGTMKKYVPFDGREWHVPEAILTEMRDRKYSHFVTVKSPDGETDIRKGRLMPEFAIEVLPPLTQAEIQALGREQKMADNR